MGYEFDNSSQNIDYGLHGLLYQSGDLSIGCWIKFSTASDNTRIIAQLDAFPIIQLLVIATVGNGYGVQAQHVKGGGSSFGVHCVPGLVDPRYKLNAGTWLYFGFSRSALALSYYSYFGSKAAMVDGPIFTYGPLEVPFPIGTPGQTVGDWVVGTQLIGAIVGPAHYWSRVLTREEHLSMARCTLPANTAGLLWWTQMLEGAADISPNFWGNTFNGTPLPIYVPDDGCKSFGTGEDYRLYNG